jgi:hypothetical protein
LTQCRSHATRAHEKRIYNQACIVGILLLFLCCFCAKCLRCRLRQVPWFCGIGLVYKTRMLCPTRRKRLYGPRLWEHAMRRKHPLFGSKFSLLPGL